MRLSDQVREETDRGNLLPTPVAQPSGNSPEDHLRKKPGRRVVTDLAIITENGLLETGGQLLPTPQANIASNGGSQHHDKRRDGGHSVSIQDVAEHLLPTPRASDGTKGGPNQAGSSGDLMLPSAVQPERFGPFAPAIRRWETVLGREAPDPTQPSQRTGRDQLSPRFVEWLMGLDPGHVTDPEIGLTRNEQLKALGNGVVPQQGAAAIADMLTTYERQDTTS